MSLFGPAGRRLLGAGLAAVGLPAALWGVLGGGGGGGPGGPRSEEGLVGVVRDVSGGGDDGAGRALARAPEQEVVLSLVLARPQVGRVLRPAAARAGGPRRRRHVPDHAVLLLRRHVVVVLRRLGVAVLRLVELLAHHVVERAAPEVQDLLERAAEVAVQRGVDDGVEQRVGVAQPQEERRDRGRDGRLVPEEGSHECEHEEGQPAEDEGAHDDAQGGRGLPLFGQEAQLPRVRRHADRGRRAGGRVPRLVGRRAPQPRHQDRRDALLLLGAASLAVAATASATSPPRRPRP